MQHAYYAKKPFCPVGQKGFLSQGTISRIAYLLPDGCSACLPVTIKQNVEVGLCRIILLNLLK